MHTRRILAAAIALLLSPLSQASFSALSNASGTPQPTYVHEDSNLVYVGNGFIELQLQKSNGGIYSIVNKMTGEDYRTDKLIGAYVFSIQGPQAYFANTFADSFTYGYSTNQSESVVTINYVFGVSTPVVVTITVRVEPNSSLSFWRISVRNPSKAVLDELWFPRINGIAQIGKQTVGNYGLVGDAMGTMVTDLYDSYRGSPKPPTILSRYPSSGGGLQLMVLGNQLGGLYLSTYDTGGNPKSFGFWKDWESSASGLPTLATAVEHHFSEVASSSISPPYDTIVGVFEGDWHAAANIYRSWAMKQWWTANGPLALRSDVPAWFKAGFAQLIMQSYQAYGSAGASGDGLHSGEWWGGVNFSQMPVLLSQSLAQVNSPVLVEWRGWEKYGLWVAPDNFPPHEGWAAFNSTISKIHAMGQHVIIPLSADDISTNYPGFDKTWLSCAVRNRNGTVYYDTYAWASVSCPRFQNWLVDTVATLAKSGADGVRLDANFQDVAQTDYNNATNHPPGYGSWWASSWTSILTRIKANVSQINPHFILGGEGLPEIFIPWIQFWNDYSSDVNADYYTQFLGAAVRPTDLFQYVYGGYAVGIDGGIWPLYGLDYGSASYLTYRDFVQALQVALGQVVDSISAGLIPQYSDLYRSLTWDSSFFSRDFSTFGIGEPPPTISVPTISFATSSKVLAYPTPAVIAGAWLSQDKRLGYLFVNVDTQPHTFTFNVNATQLNQGSNFKVVSMNRSAFNTSPFDYSNPYITVGVPPKETLVVEIVPASNVSSIFGEYVSFRASYILGASTTSTTSTTPATITTTTSSTSSTSSRTSTTTSTTTPITATTTISSQSASQSTVTTSATNTTAKGTSGGGGIPEFPIQLLIVSVFTFLIVASYAIVRVRRSLRGWVGRHPS